METINIRFGHGLGDSTYFAHSLPLYVRRGHEITVSCPSDKRILFEASGVRIAEEHGNAQSLSWSHAPAITDAADERYWLGNKIAFNIGRAPMPNIGRHEDLWRELCDQRLDLRPFIPAAVWQETRSFLASLPRPVILVHTIGNTSQYSKSLSAELTLDVYRQVLDRTEGSLILLDWDERVPKLASWRVRHLTDDWANIDTQTLVALLYESNLLIGIDSGPFHLARYTNTPTIGIFWHPDHHPIKYTLPRRQQACIVPRDGLRNWNKKARIAFNIIECEGTSISAEVIASTATRMLNRPRYLAEAELGGDVQLQQFVLDWAKGLPNSLSAHVDRHKSFDCLLREIRFRFQCPRIVETGCIRCDEDWQGAGYSTYLLGAFLHRYGGELVSVDYSATNCDFARRATSEISCVRIVCAESISFLKQFTQLIDVLLLDSLDTTSNGYAEHCQGELLAALPNLHEQSIIVCDDTTYSKRTFHGKGSLAIPWLLNRGGRILYSGYQTVCSMR